MNDNEKLYHSALSRCAEQLDNMRDGDPITDVPDFLAAKLKQCQLAGAAKGGNTIGTIDRWTGHEIMNDPSLDFVEFVKLSDAAHLAGQSQATRAVPEGWVPLSIVYNDDMEYPEEVAYGPPIMMNRLGKWLDKFMAQQIAMRDGMVLAPHFRGYAHLGIGAYVINHSPKGEPAELVISIATDEEKAGRTVGDSRDNTPDAMIQPEAMAVRLRFENVAGLDALEQQLRFVRSEHFAESAAQEVTQQAAKAETAEQAESEQDCDKAFDSWYAAQRHQLTNEQVCRLIWQRSWQAHQQAAKAVAWIDEFGNVWPLGAYSPTGKPNYHDAHKRGWKPLYLAPTTSTVSAPEEVRNQALIEAEQLCKEKSKSWGAKGCSYEGAYMSQGADELAAAIRALRTTSGKGEAA